MSQSAIVFRVALDAKFLLTSPGKLFVYLKVYPKISQKVKVEYFGPDFQLVLLSRLISQLKFNENISRDCYVLPYIP